MASAYFVLVGRKALAISAYLKQGSASLFSLLANKRAWEREISRPTALKAFCMCTAVAYPRPSVSNKPQNCKRLKSGFNASFSLRYSSLLSLSICAVSTSATSHLVATALLLCLKVLSLQGGKLLLLLCKRGLVHIHSLNTPLQQPPQQNSILGKYRFDSLSAVLWLPLHSKLLLLLRVMLF